MLTSIRPQRADFPSADEYAAALSAWLYDGVKLAVLACKACGCYGNPAQPCACPPGCCPCTELRDAR